MRHGYTLPMRPQNILIDSLSCAVLTCSHLTHVTALLHRITPNTYWVSDVHFPHYTKEFPLANIEPARYPEWTWVYKDRTFIPTPAAALTPSIQKRATLAEAKKHALTTLILTLSNIRIESSTGVAHQDGIYAEKAREAREIERGAAFDPLAHPYVAQHAEIARLEPDMAAHDILFAEKLARETLLRTEGLRLKYFHMVRDADEPRFMSEIIAAFEAEVFQNKLR